MNDLIDDIADRLDDARICGRNDARSPDSSGVEAMIGRYTSRDERQAIVVDWGRRAFGPDHMADMIVRAARFFEEAAELVQAIGLPPEHAMRAFNHVYGREPGKISQEVGGVGVTLMALCDAVGLSTDDCEVAEINRCLSKSPEHFAARNRQKVELVDAAHQQQAPVPK